MNFDNINPLNISMHDWGKFSTLSTFIAAFLKNAEILKKKAPNGNLKLMYRGQGNSNDLICPSVFRKNKLKKETQMVNELRRIAPHEFATCSSQLECLIKMQHYGLPTRLLDVTFNPLVALYFACSDEKNTDQGGKVFAFADYIHSPDEPVIERNALLSTYSGSSPKELTEHVNDHSNLLEVDGSPNRIEMKRLFGEKYHAIVAPHNNERIKRQQGGFLLFGLDVDNQNNPFQKESFVVDLPNRIEDEYLTDVGIPPEFKQEVLEDLDAIGINHAFLFPELEHQAAYIKNKYSGSSGSDESDESKDNP